MQKNFVNTIPAFNFTFELSTTATGKRQFAPITITKNIGAASPQIIQAIVTNERLMVLFQFYQLNLRGALVLHHTVKLTNAFITNFKQYFPQQNGPEFEDISFSYQKLEYTQDGSTITIDTGGA